MNESGYKQDLVSRLKARGCLTVRFEDRFTAGIPDLFVGRCGRGLWVEAKVDDDLLHPFNWSAFKQQQVVFCHQLDTIVGHSTPVFFLCYSRRRNACSWTPVCDILRSIKSKTALDTGHLYEGRGLEQILAALTALGGA